MRLGPVLPAFAMYLGMLVAVCPCVEAAEGPDAEALFESLYGGDVAKVTRTRDKADDVALAARLLETARGQDIRPALAAVLAEKAIALGARHPDGYDTAVDAADLMIEVAPEKAAEAYERLIDVREQQHRAAKGIDKIGAAETLIETLLMAADAHLDGGDASKAPDLMRQASRLARAIRSDRQEEIQARMDRASARLRSERQAETYEKKLAATPDDIATRNNLVRLCVAELDDLERAMKHLTASCAEDLKKYVPAAAKGVPAAPELACMDLGEWCRGLAEEASDTARPAFLRRAKAYYARFLDLHEAEDLARNQATLALKKVEADLAKLEAVTETRVVGPGRWVDLLPLVDPAKDALYPRPDAREECKRQEGGIFLHSPNEAFLTLPCIPAGDWQLHVTFELHHGTVGVVWPVGSARGVLWWRTDWRFARLTEGSKPDPNELAPAPLVAHQPYAIDITARERGREAEIAVKVGGRPHLYWRGDPLGLQPGPKLKNLKCIGLAACYGHSMIRKCRLRMLSGKALLLRPLRKSAGKGQAPAAKTEDVPLIANAGFEEMIQGNAANRTQWAGWGAWSWGGQYELASEARPEYVHSGKRSARIACTGEKGRIGIITPGVRAAEAVKAYTFTVWAKGEGESELFVNFEEGASGELRKRIGPEWEKVTLTGTAKPDGKGFRVFLYATGKGTLWLDDAALEPVK